MRNKKKMYLHPRKVFAVLVDGETEFWYLQMLKRNEKNISISIKPEIPQNKKLEYQYSRVIELSRTYDRVFWIVDLDVILYESSLKNKGQTKPIDIFMKYRRIIDSSHKKISIIINQPCLEFWFLLHFESSTQPFSTCEEASKKLKKYLPDYEKTEKYFTRQGSDIYLRLKGKLLAALENAKSGGTFDSQNLYSGLSEFHTFFESIGLNKAP